MSFSLSSLLNPEPAKVHSSPEEHRNDTLPPMNLTQSPTQEQAKAPPHVAPSPQQPYNYPPATAQEAAQALASLSASSAPPPTHYYGFSAPDYAQAEHRRSSGHRSSSMAIELPPPSAGPRKMSTHSPTLEQYHVSSRSPEQRRPSMISPAQPGFTLPPMQGFEPTQQEQTRRASVAQSPVQRYGDAQAAASHAHPPAADASNSLQTALSHESGPVRVEPDTARMRQPTPPVVTLPSAPSMAAQMDGAPSSPAAIKEESMPTPRASSPIDARRPSVVDMDGHTPKAVASLKNEHSMRTQSPLRESSVPVPSTEMQAPEQATASRKRPAPSKGKKGTATATKRAPPSKKRKLEVKRSETPSSRSAKPSAFKTGSSKGTPANSSPAPSNRSHSAELNDEPYSGDEGADDDERDADDDVYCICRKPDNGTFMIGCDGTCDDWFHGKCVGIEERDKNLIDKYLCPSCTKAGVGKTSWKRMCRRGGCRQPARVGKSKSGKDGSKYCSEECGVLYFREMVARTRNREDTVKDRSNRRKNSVVESERPIMDDDLGAKGGMLAAGEVKSLIDSTKTAEDFKKLGEGVLSPPATPDGKDAPTVAKESNYTEAEAHALEQIRTQKEDARRRHQLLKDRMKFITMVKQAGSRTATEKELKPKEYCGYDPRLEWTEEQFAVWRDSPAGTQAFELETLATEHSNISDKNKEADTAIGEDADEGVYAQLEVCDRKKCPRHLEWPKLAVDDLRFEMSDNSDNMRALDKEEREIRERAALRAKVANVNGEGTVEVHGLGITNGETVTGEQMEIDAPAQVQQPTMVAEMAEVGAERSGLPEAEAMAVDAVA